MSMTPKMYEKTEQLKKDLGGDDISASSSNDLLCDKELLKRSREFQENMFFREPTLSDNGTVSLLIKKVEELYRERQALIDELNT